MKCKLCGMERLDSEKFIAIASDLVDETFPKGECKERGKAIVLIASLNIALQKFAAPQIDEGKIDKVLSNYSGIRSNFCEGAINNIATAIKKSLEAK